MTVNVNEEWGNFAPSAKTSLQNGGRGRVDALSGMLDSYPRPSNRAPNNGNNELPGIFGSFQRTSQVARANSRGELLKPSTGSSMPDRKNSQSRILSNTLQRTRHSEIDTKKMSCKDLCDLEKKDPFMYYSIPAVNSASRFLEDIDLKEVQRPSRMTMMRSMESCPSMMTSSLSSSGAQRCQSKVKRRTRISHEIHSTLLLLDDDDDEEVNDDDGVDIVSNLIRAMSKNTL